MKNNDFDILTIVRYSIYFAVAASIIASQSQNMVLLLVLLLIYIINAQLRAYFLKSNTYAVFFSLILEIVVISFLCSNFGGFTFVYFFISVIDSSSMLNKWQSVLINVSIYIAIILNSIHPDYKYLELSPAVNIIFNTLIVVGFGGLANFMNKQKEKKIEAQNLYDRLRISEQQLKEAYSRLEQYSNTVEELAILKERNRISREMHDIVGHTMSTMIVQLQALPFVIKSEPDKAKEMIDNMLLNTKTGLENVRRAVKELNPVGFDTKSGIFMLKELVKNFEKNSGIKIKFTICEDCSIDLDHSLILYRIFQESFNNSLNHGKATEIEINLNIDKNEIYARIKDNGTGCKDFKKGFGISGMEQRIKSMNGKIEFHNECSSGFEINLTLPQNSTML